MPIDHARIHQGGWRQGKLLTVEASRNLLDECTHRPQPPGIELPEGTRLVVVSHSCDVCAPSQLEVGCEFCPAIPLPPGQTAAQFGNARDPRRLRLQVIVDGQPQWHELYAPLRFTHTRASLEEIVPDAAARIEEQQLWALEVWLAARYRRRVLPNTFDARLDTNNHKRIRTAIKPVEEHILSVLFSLSPDEEIADANVPYQLRVALLVRSADLINPGVLEGLEVAKDKVEEILQEREGIEATVELAGDEEMTVAQFRNYSRWGLEDLSIEAGDDEDGGVGE